MTDFLFSDHGSVTILTALTAAANEWIDAHLPEDRQTWGPCGTVIEPRYAAAIIEGLQADGLTVNAE